MISTEGYLLYVAPFVILFAGLLIYAAFRVSVRSSDQSERHHAVSGTYAGMWSAPAKAPGAGERLSHH